MSIVSWRSFFELAKVILALKVCLLPTFVVAQGEPQSGILSDSVVQEGLPNAIVVQGVALTDKDDSLVAVDVDQVAFSNAKEMCPSVNCDCEALEKNEWIRKCAEVELKIAVECEQNGGVALSYCGIHGPNASPVALSISSPQIRPIESVSEAGNVKKQISAKIWSISSDLKMLEESVAAMQLAQAIQIHRLVDRRIEELFQLKFSLHRGLEILREKKMAEEGIVSSAKETNDLGAAVDKLSLSLWKIKERTDNDKFKKAHEILSFRLARSAGKLLEYNASILADVGRTRLAASVWEESAKIAERLVGWADKESKSIEVVNLYRQQASTRWQRAAFYWVKNEKADLANAAETHYTDLAAQIQQSQNTLIGGSPGLTAP